MCRGKAEYLALNDRNMVVLLVLVLSLVSTQMHEKNVNVNVFLCSLDMTTYAGYAYLHIFLRTYTLQL